MIKLVAIDIDGTLVNEEKVMSKKVRDAIHKANDLGVKVVLCTGRPIEGILPYLKELNFQDDDDFVISHNGACITQTDTMEVVEARTLKSEDIKTVYDLLKDYPGYICTLNEKNFYLIDKKATEPLLKEAQIINMELEEVGIDFFEQADEMLKMICMGDEKEIDVIESVIPEDMQERYYIVRSQRNLIEVLKKDTNKGTALEKLAEKLGFSMDEVMAIGDGDNDYEMIQAAGLGVVMENGTEKLKNIANQLTLSNEEDGVAHAFEKWVFQK